MSNHQLTHFTDPAIVAFHPKNKEWLVAAGKGGQVELWDIRQKSLVQKTSLPTRQNLARLSFDKTGQYLAISSFNRLDIWDIYANKVLFYRTFKGVVSAQAFDSKSNRLLVTGIGLDDTGANLLLLDLTKRTAKTYHVNAPIGLLWGDVTFWYDSNHFIETNLYTSELSLYEITPNGVEPKLSLLFLDDGEAIFSEPSTGQDWATQEGTKYITFQSGNQISRINQLDAKLLNPTRIQEILQCQEP